MLKTATSEKEKNQSSDLAQEYIQHSCTYAKWKKKTQLKDTTRPTPTKK